MARRLLDFACQVSNSALLGPGSLLRVGSRILRDLISKNPDVVRLLGPSVRLCGFDPRISGRSTVAPRLLPALPSKGKQP